MLGSFSIWILSSSMLSIPSGLHEVVSTLLTCNWKEKVVSIQGTWWLTLIYIVYGFQGRVNELAITTVAVSVWGWWREHLISAFSANVRYTMQYYPLSPCWTSAAWELIWPTALAALGNHCLTFCFYKFDFIKIPHVEFDFWLLDGFISIISSAFILVVTSGGIPLRAQQCSAAYMWGN